LNKEPFYCTRVVTKYFEELKEVMCTTPFLVTPKFTKTFIVECDASGHGIGAFLMKEERDIAFESSQIKGKTYTNQFMKNK
jgi:hypothetical protein